MNETKKLHLSLAQTNNSKIMKTKQATSFLAILLFMMAGCGGGNKKSATQNDALFTVDVTASYPKKELILQDIMDVEYIPLESSNEFITTGWVHAIGNDIIVVRNRRRASDGDIFLFDRKGNGLRKVNRLGQGNEEYVFLLGVTLDEDSHELFVNDHYSKRILVYDLFGKYKRTLPHAEGCRYGDVYNFDRDHLICQDDELDDNFKGKRNEYLVISKQDGSIKKEIEIPYKDKISSMVVSEQAVMPIRNRTLVPQGSNSWTLLENSADTIYRFFSDYRMEPQLVRTPTIQTMRPGTFLYPAVLTDRYCFMQTVEAYWDWEANTGHTRINLMYDRQEKALYEYVMYNADRTDKQPIIMTSEITFGDDIVACVHVLESYDLVEARDKGQLKGKLKEIADTLDEESNAVIMLVKYKK